MRTLAIVSSFNESCGNAAFTKILQETIQQFSEYKVEVIALKLPLLQSVDRRVRRMADEHIANICDRLKKFDSVNIQLETGLYGTLPNDIVNRISRLSRANSNTSVTLHSPRLTPSDASDVREIIKDILSLKIKKGFTNYILNLKKNVNIKINFRIVKKLVKINCRLIVHTVRAKEDIMTMYKYTNVDVHPLQMVEPSEKYDGQIIDNLKLSLDLENTSKIIGVFGYISAYKGHLDALNAMTYLPKEYKLFIFGRQHPQTIKSNGQLDGYIGVLIKRIENDNELKNRVFFIGELNDHDFISVAASVDVVLLPYYENGQDGSGIASICFDISKRVLCSASFAFDELFKLIPYNALRFDIGNSIEIAHKTKIAMHSSPGVIRDGINKKYNLKTQALLYIK